MRTIHKSPHPHPHPPPGPLRFTPPGAASADRVVGIIPSLSSCPLSSDVGVIYTNATSLVPWITCAAAYEVRRQPAIAGGGRRAAAQRGKACSGVCKGRGSTHHVASFTTRAAANQLGYSAGDCPYTTAYNRTLVDAGFPSYGWAGKPICTA